MDGQGGLESHFIPVPLLPYHAVFHYPVAPGLFAVPPVAAVAAAHGNLPVQKTASTRPPLERPAEAGGKKGGGEHGKWQLTSACRNAGCIRLAERDRKKQPM